MIRLEVRRGSFNGAWTVDCVMHNTDGSQEFSERLAVFRTFTHAVRWAHNACR